LCGHPRVGAADVEVFWFLLFVVEGVCVCVCVCVCEEEGESEKYE
jgi:hypothetical protein